MDKHRAHNVCPPQSWSALHPAPARASSSPWLQAPSRYLANPYHSSAHAADAANSFEAGGGGLFFEGAWRVGVSGFWIF